MRAEGGGGGVRAEGAGGQVSGQKECWAGVRAEGGGGGGGSVLKSGKVEG